MTDPESLEALAERQHQIDMLKMLAHWKIAKRAILSIFARANGRARP